MLISHRYRFILLKTEKTASTSLLEVFRRIVTEDGTELLDPTPATKAQLVREGKRLDEVSFSSKRTGRRLVAPSLFGLHHHGRARDARAFLGPEVFDKYVKITSERNPWDRQVSLYCHRNKKHDRLDIKNFNRDTNSPVYNLFHKNRLDNWGIYAIDDRVVADFVVRFETLEDDFREVLKALGFDPARHKLPRLRTSYRPATDYRDIYFDETRERVGAWYRREIEHFGYTF